MVRHRAFTLAEMLVVIAIIILLVAILLPTVTHAWDHARQVQCMSNMRQVTQALLQYTADSQNYFLPLDSTTAQVGKAAGTDSREVIPALNKYLRSPAVFHCPCDPREGTLTYPINDFLGGTWKHFWHPAKRLLDVTNPATTFAVIEETDYFPKVANDSGGFVVETRAADVWIDAPATLHVNHMGTCLSFVDGHCECWIWSDLRTPTLTSRKRPVITPNNPDLTRLQNAVGGN